MADAVTTTRDLLPHERDALRPAPLWREGLRATGIATGCAARVTIGAAAVMIPPLAVLAAANPPAAVRAGVWGLAVVFVTCFGVLLLMAKDRRADRRRRRAELRDGKATRSVLTAEAAWVSQGTKAGEELLFAFRTDSRTLVVVQARDLKGRRAGAWMIGSALTIDRSPRSETLVAASIAPPEIPLMRLPLTENELISSGIKSGTVMRPYDLGPDATGVFFPESEFRPALRRTRTQALSPADREAAARYPWPREPRLPLALGCGVTLGIAFAVVAVWLTQLVFWIGGGLYTSPRQLLAAAGIAFGSAVVIPLVLSIRHVGRAKVSSDIREGMAETVRAEGTEVLILTQQDETVPAMHLHRINARTLIVVHERDLPDRAAMAFGEALEIDRLPRSGVPLRVRNGGRPVPIRLVTVEAIPEDLRHSLTGRVIHPAETGSDLRALLFPDAPVEDEFD